MSTLNILAYITCIGYCVSTVVLSEVTQVTIGKFHYPFILRYINTIQQIVFFPIILIWKCYRSHANKTTNIIATHINDKNNIANWFIYYSILSATLTSMSGILINISLQHITIPTYSAISGMRPVSVLILSILFISEKITLWKISAMTMALIGVLLFVFELKNHSTISHGETHDTFIGVLLVLAWTVGFSINDIVTKKFATYCLENDKYIIGSILFIVISSIVVLFLFCWTLFYPENIEWSSITMDQLTLVLVLLNGCVIFMIHLCLYVCVALKSPFFISLGNLNAIPLAFIVDIFVHDYKPNLYAIFGAISIIISFLMLEIIKPTNKICKTFQFCNNVLSVCRKKHDGDNKPIINENLWNERSFDDKGMPMVFEDQSDFSYKPDDSIQFNES